jgi:hypothetical protein
LDPDPAEARRRYARLMSEEDTGFAPRFDADQKPPRRSKAPRSAASLEDIACALHAESGVPFLEVRPGSRPRHVSRLRKEFTGRAAALGHTHSAIAKFLGVHPSAVTQYARA